LHVPESRLWFKGEQHTTGAVPFIFIIYASRLFRFHRQRDQHSTQELTGPLIITEQRLARIIGASVLVQDVFPMPKIFAGDLP